MDVRLDGQAIHLVIVRAARVSQIWQLHYISNTDWTSVRVCRVLTFQNLIQRIIWRVKWTYESRVIAFKFRSNARSLVCLLARSVARAMYRSLSRLLAGPLARSLSRSLDRSIDRWLESSIGHIIEASNQRSLARQLSSPMLPAMSATILLRVVATIPFATHGSLFGLHQKAPTIKSCLRMFRTCPFVLPDKKCVGVLVVLCVDE